MQGRGTRSAPFPALRPKAVLFTLRVFTTRHTRLPQECAGLNCVHAHTDPISLGSQPGFVTTRFSEKAGFVKPAPRAIAQLSARAQAKTVERIQREAEGEA